MKNLARLVALWFMILASVSLQAQSQPFRFAFLTDLHVGTTTGEEDLQRSVEDVNRQANIDFVWVNGDVTELGTDQQLALAKSILDKLNVPYYIVAGNHETGWSESGSTRFKQLFGDNKWSFEHKGVQFVGVISGPVVRMGDGYVSPFDMTWLEKTLSALPDKHIPIIFCTHYPLDSGLDNWYDVTNILRQYNTKVTLCGHGHSNVHTLCEGIPSVMCRSNLRAKQPVGGYTLVDVAKDSIRFSEKLIGQPARQWYSQAMNATYSKEPTNPIAEQFSVNSSYPHVAPKWTFKAAGIVASSPAYSDGKIVVGDETGSVYCLSENDGKLAWTFQARQAVYSSPAIADGKVVFGSCDSSIYCLNVKDGKKVWEYKTNHTVMGVPLIDKGIVYIGGSDGCFRAINLKDGKLKWDFCQLKGYVISRPLMYEGKLIFGAWDTYLYALDPQTGKLAWKWTNNGTMHLSPAVCNPVGAHGKVFVVAPDRYMTALDVKTGSVVWRENKHRVRETIGLSEDGEKVYARCFVDTLFAVSAKADRFDELWFAKCGYTYDINPSMPVEKDGSIFFATKNGFFVALNALNGQVLWQHKLGNTMVNTVTPINNRRIIFSAHDGTIGMLEWRQR